MDLSAVARQSISRRVEASASASASRRTEEEEEDDEDLDADEAKALVRAFVKHALDGVRGGERVQPRSKKHGEHYRNSEIINQ